MSKICIYTIFLLALISCRKSQHDSVLAVLKEWEQREILFPSCPVFTIQGKDTVDYKYQGIYKIVSYVDSSGCTSCKLHLHDWAKLIDEFDSIYPNTVQFLFYFSPRKQEEIRRTLLLNKFYYPICIDEQDSINILNNFPSDFNFQTFLLDADNKIIAVGNPVYNIKIKELYTKIISGEERILSLKYGEELQTSVALDRDFINIGTFDWEQEQIVELRVSNIGKNFQAVGEYEKAEEYFIRSTHRLPGRIYPYYLLAKLYAEPEYWNPEKLKRAVQIVLTKEPKVQSTAIKEMREEVKLLI